VSIVTYLLRIADDNMVVGQRLSELISRMPELELDIAVANIALDHIGQARHLYAYAGEQEGVGRDEDALAMARNERQYLNAVLVEQPNGDFAHTMARQFFFDAYQVPLYEALSGSADSTLAGIAAKAVKEARYHRDHSSAWIARLGGGTEESHQRMQAGIGAMWPFTADLFVADGIDEELAAIGVAADLVGVRQAFEGHVNDTFASAGLSLPEDPYQRLGGRDGFHTEHLGHLLAEMQRLYLAHPGAQW